MSARQVAVGIDVGGTFTDLAAIGADGRVRTTKVLSLPSDRAAGVLGAVDAAAIAAADVAYLAHGTTVVTNLLLERRGARVSACATRGFTDLLELRRQDRAALYDLTRHHPAPLVAAGAVEGVRERLVPAGVLEALDGDEIDRVVHTVLDGKPETVAICFLHSYGNSAHEAALRDAFRAEVSRRDMDCDIVCSHEVLPEIREYERMATTVAEAYARPAVRRYLDALTTRLVARDLPSPRVMTSAGGTLDAATGSSRAALLALSGPAGGVTGAAAVLRSLGIPEALTIDIGGTSADVGIVIDGEPLVERGGNVAGVPIALPRVLVEAVAAGGGSIGWVDAGGALRAGPQSAGASPGPACYGLGGDQPTITDGHVVLGNVAAGTWSGGVTIDAALARTALAPLAASLGVTMERAAAALIATADATMARALRRVSVERGIDPRDVALVAFGGGGPLHACGLADGLGMRRIVVPPHAGVLSAVGLAIAPDRRERIASYIGPVRQVTRDEIARLLAAEAVQLRSGVAGTSAGDRATDRATDAAVESRWWMRTRYVGQGHELDVPVTPTDSGSDVALRFAALHDRRMGFTLDRDVECISVRTALVGPPWPVAFSREQVDTPAPPLDADDGSAFDRSLRGPAVVRLSDATLLVADGWTARTLPTGGWMLERT
jgi:N-methylhydantoinase A